MRFPIATLWSLAIIALQISSLSFGQLEFIDPGTEQKYCIFSHKQKKDKDKTVVLISITPKDESGCRVEEEINHICIPKFLRNLNDKIDELLSFQFNQENWEVDLITNLRRGAMGAKFSSWSENARSHFGKLLRQATTNASGVLETKRVKEYHVNSYCTGVFRYSCCTSNCTSGTRTADYYDRVIKIDWSTDALERAPQVCRSLNQKNITHTCLSLSHNFFRSPGDMDYYFDRSKTVVQSRYRDVSVSHENCEDGFIWEHLL